MDAGSWKGFIQSDRSSHGQFDPVQSVLSRACWRVFIQYDQSSHGHVREVSSSPIGPLTGSFIQSDQSSHGQFDWSRVQERPDFYFLMQRGDSDSGRSAVQNICGRPTVHNMLLQAGLLYIKDEQSA